MTKWMCPKTFHYDCYFDRKMKNKIEMLFCYQFTQFFVLFTFGIWMLFKSIKCRVAKWYIGNIQRCNIINGLLCIRAKVWYVKISLDFSMEHSLSFPSPKVAWINSWNKFIINPNSLLLRESRFFGMLLFLYYFHYI